MYSEVDLTWSSIEKFYNYSKVVWSVGKEGISRYTLLDENNRKIEVKR
jgi:hypothetical protein